jgi:sugar transferase (PEP-CTERM/EpsH1 system associated)
MREFSPHIVHTRNFGALEAIAAARISGVPITIHSEHGYELEILAGLPLRRRLLCRTLYPLADTVFTVTNNLRNYHSQQSWLPKERFRVIHNGVNTESYAPHRELTASVRSRLGIPVGRIVIGNVGRLVPIKDQATLFRAAEMLIDIGKDVHLLIVGSGPELAKLRARAEGSRLLAGRVTFELESDRIPELMNAMDMFALTSICEGMSNTILEAMATGLPVVATRSGGNPELVEHGRTGWLFSPRDAEALAQGLIRLVDDSELRRHFGQESRRTAVDRFSLLDMIRGYRDLYVDLAALRGVWKGN